MIRTFCIASALVLIASQAIALSCVHPNPFRTAQERAASPDRYIMAFGELRAIGARPSRPETTIMPDQLPTMTYAAQFVGMAASRQGFETPIEARVMITETCLAAWCGQANLDTQMLVFLKEEAQGYSLTAGPCDMGGGFPNLTRDDLRIVRRCAFGGACNAAEFDNR